MTLKQIESGEGRMVQGQATILQRGAEDVFDTEPAESGWTNRPGWHVAGAIYPSGRIDWCDLWPIE